MSAAQEAVLRCDFCGKSEHEVKKLIAGPAGKAGPVCICDECVMLSLDIIGAEQRTDGERPLSHEELRLRDQYAGQAMQAAATNPKGADGFTFEQRAEWAFQQADAMLKARRA